MTDSPSAGAPVPIWLWLVFGAVVVALLALDLGAHRIRRSTAAGGADSPRAALAWTAFWIGCALAFNGVVALVLGAEAGEEFFGAYVLEKSLSIDNLFVFLLVFQRMGVAPHQERRVLSWGILGALVSRGVFIALGAALLERWHAVVYVFGAVLVVSGLKMLRPASGGGGGGRLTAWLSRVIPFAPDEGDGARFVVRRAGKWFATPLLVALLAVEITDVAFAVDSIPAAFAVTESPFIVYASNIFAVLGLRSLYVVLARALSGLAYLHYGLAAVLVFAGAKMLGSDVVHVSTLASLAVIGAAMGLSVVASLVKRRRDGARMTPVTPVTSAAPGGPEVSAVRGRLHGGPPSPIGAPASPTSRA